MSPPEMANIWIPAVSGLVGALIGGAITYCTVRQQLQHASKEARLTREHVLKREVYLEAAEGIARSVNYLASISRSDLTIQQLSHIPGETGAWVYRVHVVGDLDTVKALDRANESLLHHCLDLMVKKMKWEEVRGEAAALHDQLAQRGADAEQLVAVLQALSAPDAPPDARVLAHQVTQDIRAVHTEMAELVGVCRQASDRQYQAHRDLVAASWQALAEQGPLLADAVVHLRRELDLPLDEKDYLDHSEQGSRRSLARLKELLDQLDNE